MSARFDIDIEDTPFDPQTRSRVVRYRESGGKTLYKVLVRLVGADVPFVRSVTYHLHETFTTPTRTIDRTASNPDYALDLWLWGVFELRAIVTDIHDNRHEVYHYLEFDSYFEPEKFEKFGLKLERA